MAPRRRPNSRVTAVSPWIWGGEGQLRDLFPLPPYLLLTLRTLNFIFIRHWYITLSLLLSLLLYIIYDWHWILAFIITPIALITAYTTAAMGYLWYRNPQVPIIVRKSDHD